MIPKKLDIFGKLKLMVLAFFLSKSKTKVANEKARNWIVIVQPLLPVLRRLDLLPVLPLFEGEDQQVKFRSCGNSVFCFKLFQLFYKLPALFVVVAKLFSQQ